MVLELLWKSATLLSINYNQDLKNLTYWLNATKICLRISKAEVTLFRSARKRANVTLTQN